MSCAARRTFLAALLLAGCAATDLDRGSTQRQGVHFLPDERGLAVAGRAERIDFGRAPSGVIAALDRELGQGKALGLGGCPESISDRRSWEGLVLTFSRERFVGWQQGEARYGTVCGPSG